MSVSQYIACDNCKKKLWVGEHGEICWPTALGVFIYEHKGHRLIFESEFWFDDRPGEYTNAGVSGIEDE